MEVGDLEVSGWTLNVSVGEVRAVIEHSLEPGTEVMVRLGGVAPRSGRIVWVQDEPDGSIVGVSFLEAPHPPPVA